MRLYQIGLALTAFFLFTPSFADQCPTADKVMHCSSGECSLQRLTGWSTEVFYMDKGKPFSFQKVRVENAGHHKKISCYYTYINPESHRMMPPALVLRTMVN